MRWKGTNEQWPPHASGLALSSADLPNHCANASPIDQLEFSHRQGELAKALEFSGASAYIAEPGANSLFFTNVSQSNWKLSERPLLLVVTPGNREKGLDPSITVLTPRFEATRAKLLPIPASAVYIEWPEEANPYEIMAASLPDLHGIIYVDNNIRKFIVDGLQAALPNQKVVSAPAEITQLRERKSATEIGLLKCANEATLLAIRSVHQKMFIGMRESQARDMMTDALSAVGLQNGGCLTLFGENAALPHGSGTDRALGIADFALFDCTASLYGYYSDVTRTVALPGSQIPYSHQQVWSRVQLAQRSAAHTAHQGVLTSQVDAAARAILRSWGYGAYFTHRLGHGIGLEVHEQPYLRGGSSDIIQIGHTFSNEPGVYIEGQVGVRLEDCFYIDQHGKSVYLTQGAGGPSKSYLDP
ncbi:Creatinase/aminopeptidase [Infundibulicybe gibba]|nr:Creatinase/aminopeptidase [Infundibulicybe gibba]